MREEKVLEQDTVVITQVQILLQNIGLVKRGKREKQLVKLWEKRKRGKRNETMV